MNLFLDTMKRTVVFQVPKAGPQGLGDLFKFLFSMCIMWHLAACSAPQKITPPETTGPQVETTGPQAETRDTGGYYYYAESRLMRRQGELDRAIELLNEAVVRDQDSIFLKKELVQLYLHQKDYQTALGVAQDIVEGQPEDVASLVMLAGIYAALNRHGEAIETYEKALAIDPKSENAYLLLGAEHVKVGDLEKATMIYQELIEMNPESFSGHFYLGNLYKSKQEYEKAEAAYLKAIELKPDYEKTYFELISLYETTARPERAIEVYKKMLDGNPRNLRALVGLGRAYLKTGKSSKASEVFEKVRQQSKSDPGVVKQIALIYLDEKQYGAAVDTLQLLLTEEVDNPELHYFLGMAFEGLEKTDAAIAAYEKVPESSSYYKSAVIHLGFLYDQGGDPEKAIHLLQEAIDKNPGEAELHLFLGALYEEMELYDRAVAILKEGLETDGETIRLRFRLGVVYDKAGNKEACIEEMKAVIGADPNHAEALNYLGYTYADLGINLDEAEVLVKRAMNSKPNDGYITDSLGWVYYKKGLYERAVGVLKEAARLANNDPTILEHLGDAYIKLNNPKKGLEAYRKALEKKGEKKEALEQKIQSVEKQLGQGT
jgi:tetratricopeptide (TPR) repeat protein